MRNQGGGTQVRKNRNEEGGSEREGEKEEKKECGRRWIIKGHVRHISNFNLTT